MEDRIYRPGEKISHYQVMELLGVGGFSAVYKAQDLKDSPNAAPSAVKISRYDFRSVPENVKHELNARTRREFDLLQHLEHRSIISVLEPGFSEGVAWYAMEWLEGYVALGSSLADERRRYWDLALMFRQLASALSHAHRSGVVHRDITPGNILLSPEAEELEEVEFDDLSPPPGIKRSKWARVPVLIDFGISQVLGVAPITGPGALLGTAEYLSPGYARVFLDGASAPYRAEPHDDVYQAGVLLYSMLAGRLPTQTPPSQLADLLKEIRAVPPPPVLSVNPDAPPAMAELAMLCLEKRGEDRPADGTELLWRFNKAMFEDSAHLVRLAPEYRVGEGTAASQLPPSVIARARPESPAPAAPESQPERMGPFLQMSLSFAAALVVLILVSAFVPMLSSGRTLVLHVSSAVDSEALIQAQLGPKVVVRRMVPPHPGKGQMRGPCDVGLVEINSGCWIGPIKGMEVPCAPKFYEYNNECYRPAAADPSQPMSMEEGDDGDGGSRQPPAAERPDAPSKQDEGPPAFTPPVFP